MSYYNTYMSEILTFNNVEDLIFYDKQVRQLMPNLSACFSKWDLGRRGGIVAMAKEAVVELLSSITADNLAALSAKAGKKFDVRRVDMAVVHNGKCDKEGLVAALDGGNVVLSRDGDRIGYTIWR